MVGDWWEIYGGRLIVGDYKTKFIGSLHTIQYKHEYYHSGINPVEFRGHSKTSIIKTIVKNWK